MTNPPPFKPKSQAPNVLDPLNMMGDDGDGNCWGCGEPLDRINVECPVCLQAHDAMWHGEQP